MELQKDRNGSAVAETRRLAEKRSSAETTELHPFRTREAPQKFVQVKRRLGGGQV